MKRTTFKRKYTAIKAARTGRRVYKVKGGYRVSPECPRQAGKRGALIKKRRKTAKRRPAKGRRFRFFGINVDVPF